MKNKLDPKAKNALINLGLIILFVIAMTLFCKIMQYSLIIPLFLFFLGTHLYLTKNGDIRLFIHLGLLLTIIVVTTHVIIHKTPIPAYYIPVAGIALLTVLLFNDLQLTFIMAFISSLFVSLMIRVDFGIMLTFFIGSLTGAYIVRDARTRGRLFTAGFCISILHIVCLILLNPDKGFNFSWEFTKMELIPFALNGFISILLVAATLKIFESLFGALTNFSLLELADFNQPLLKRMILEAPGTYHHSLVVSNLSEAAADAIGANALLTRVGAYYHDIGKMAKSEYFTENQLVGGNVHDSIEPSMSRLVVLNHVKEGIDLAKKYKLNSAIVDFIPQHHGTGLMYYFYQKALEEAEEGETVNEEDFRYPGPKPQTRETAITLLADSVEGATRALDDPNPTNIQETVQKIINNKFIDGQLDECPLTLKEIDLISVTFTRILSAMYHSRVKYPEKKNGKNGNTSRKSAEKNIPQPPKDQNNNESHP